MKLFSLPNFRPSERWQDRLGPFGAYRYSVALLTLVAFVSTTLKSSFAWAEAAHRGDAARIALDSGELYAESRAPSSAQVARSVAKTRDLAVNRDEARSNLKLLSPAELRAATSSTSDLAPSITAEVDGGATHALALLPKASAPVAAQAISLPSGAATVSGMGESFTAQLTTGIATFNVPLSIPSARGAAQPSFNLVYSSSGGFGDAGVGWSLAGGVFIARQTDRGTPSYDDRADFYVGQDRFIFGGQELVPICTVDAGACSGALANEVFPQWADAHQYFRSRVEGSFLRFFWSPDHRTWRIQSKAGLHFELGVPLDGSTETHGLEANPARPAEIYRWHLVRQYDSHGEPDAVPTPLPSNVVVYRYRDDGGIRYLSDVLYTPPASAPRTTDLSLFAHHVQVQWQARPDRASSYRAGFVQTQRLRLARVDVTSKPFDGALASSRQLVRRFHIAYEAGLHASLLTRVSPLCGDVPGRPLGVS